MARKPLMDDMKYPDVMKKEIEKATNDAYGKVKELEKAVEIISEENQRLRKGEEERKSKIPLGLMKRKKDGKEGKRYKEPILMEIGEDGLVEIMEDVKPGMMELKTSKGKKVLAYLDPKRTVMIPDGEGGEYRAWIHYEKEMGCYPLDVVNDITQATNIITNLQGNYRDLDILGKLGKLGDINTIRKLAIGGIVILMVIILVVWYATPGLSPLIGKAGVEMIVP